MPVPNIEEEKDLVKKFRSEVNLLAYPFFALTSKDVFTRRKTEFKTVVRRGGEKLEILWRVTSDPEYGHPGPFGKKIYRAIEQIIEEIGFPVENPIRFSIYELCKRMEITPGGSNYEKIKGALERMISTTIKSKGTFFHKGTEHWIDDTFHLYERIVFKGRKLEDGSIADTNCLFLGRWYLESLNARYVKPLDFEYYKNLVTNVAQRLYELLGVKFYGIFDKNQSYIRYRYSTLCQLLPLIPQDYLSKAKTVLEPAHKELVKTEFLKEARWEEIEHEKGDWLIYYYPGPRAKAEIERYRIPKESQEKKTDRKLAGPKKPKEEIKNLVSKMGKELGKEEENRDFYQKIAQRCPQNLIHTALSDTQAEARANKINKDKPAFFGYWIQELAKQRGIDLGLKSSKED